jgi:hypothetical protein
MPHGAGLHALTAADAALGVKSYVNHMNNLLGEIAKQKRAVRTHEKSCVSIVPNLAFFCKSW